MQIPLAKPDIGRSEVAAFRRILAGDQLSAGPEVERFEKAVADYLGVKHAVACNSGTSALWAAYMLLRTHCVWLPSFTFVATANAALFAGARPLFCDIVPSTGNIDVSKAYRGDADCIVPVHLFGHPADMNAVLIMAKRCEWRVIEDCAEAFGAEYGGHKVGTFGDIGCFSFFPTKNITTCEGGMLVTNSDELAHNARLLLAHGIDRANMDPLFFWRRDARMVGMNMRMAEPLAAVGLAQLKRVDAMNDRRRELARLYNRKLKMVEELQLPVERKGCKHVYQMYTVRVPFYWRDKIVLRLRERGIGASVHFDPPVHMQEAYQNWRAAELPVTRALCRSILTLPMYSRMTKEDVKRVCAELKRIIDRLRRETCGVSQPSQEAAQTTG